MTAAAGPFVRYQQDGRVVTLTLDRPESRNAIATHQDCEELAGAFERAGADPGVSCLILTGAGSAFSAGGNIKAMKERNGIGPLDAPDATRANYKRGVQRIARAMWECEVPAIAAVNGHAVGLGLDLACLCDIRLGVEGAKFASSFIKLGIVPGDGGAWILPRAVGLSQAAEMIFTGDTLDAQEALRIGLVSRLLPADKLLPEALALAQRIAANPARSLRLAKRLLREGQQQRLADLLELSAAFQAMAHETQDHREAVDAFIEKRSPEFRGG
ncbi:MAG: crotonase/enoyl-CoA hydratase family protein [Nevskia sp.]|nr:crotonase/enoyl-CoA hydratase family protein [Nevskia sp.]